MIRSASETEWRRFATQISKAREAGEPVLPAQAPYRGVLPGTFDYVLPDDVLGCLRDWLYGRGEARVLYFLTEKAGSQEDEANFDVDVWDLTEDALSEVNSGFESVITSSDFAWAVFVGHEGRVHVAGPEDLHAGLTACAEARRTEPE